MYPEEALGLFRVAVPFRPDIALEKALDCTSNEILIGIAFAGPALVLDLLRARVPALLDKLDGVSRALI